MKIALLGDIHGNHHALKAVLDAALQHGAERLLVTGDLVGYYFWPGEVLELLSRWDVAMVRGNHEEMLAKARSNSLFMEGVDEKYGTGLRIAAEQLETRQLDMLCCLPHPLEIVVDGSKILFCHGSPWDINRYIYPDADHELLERSALQEYDVVVMGHTHYPYFKQVGRTNLINSGSVGQPRNRQPGAHWALFDTESCTVSLLCESYNAEPVIAEARSRHPDIPYLAEVLERK